MDFANLIRYFDRDEVLDAYSGAVVFMGHTMPHDDHTSSGATSRRRTLVSEPSAVAPARRAVSIEGEYWLVGVNNLDTFLGDPVRRNFDLKKSTGQLEALTPGAACLAQAGATFHAHKEYFRDTTNGQTTSEWDPMWNVFCPLNETLATGYFLRDGSTLLRVRNCYTSIDEFRVAEADEFASDAVQDVTFTGAGTLDLVTDTVSGTSITTTALQTDTGKFYRFRTQSEAGLQAGDRAVFVAKSAVTPKQGDTFTMQGVTWRAALIVDELDAWAILARRT